MQLFLVSLQYKCLKGFQFSKRFQHSHKKQKEILKAQAKLAVLCSYVMNQTIREHTLLSLALKCRQIKDKGS